MSQKSRTKLSQRNFIFSLLGRVIGMITAFVGRGIFVKTLNSEYLGLGGFFGNIFSVISLCELGIGAAIAQSLYKPLADNDDDAVTAAMGFFSKVNTVVATVTLILSVCAMSILPLLAKSNISYRELYMAYILFTLHTAISYMLSPKRNLVVCDQKLYVVTVANTVMSVVALALQSAVLILSKSYIAYLVTRILLLTVRDIWINRYADKKYPFLSKKIRPQKGYYRKISENVKALLWHKIGGTLCRSTDSLLLSVYVGLSGMGKYSNYALVIGTVGAFFDVAINAASASVGNLGAVDRAEKSEQVMRKMYFLNFFLLTLGLCVLVATVNPFVTLWLGENMTFSDFEMGIIVACFYVSCVRDPVQIFLHTYGIFRQTELIPVVRAAVNFVLSVFFVKRMGMSGVFLGTLISTVTVPLYFEVRQLYKYGLGNRNAKPFLKEMCSYIAISTLLAITCFAVTRRIPCTAVGVLTKGIISLIISLCALCIVYSKSSYFEYCKNMLYKVMPLKHDVKRRKVQVQENQKQTIKAYTFKSFLR